MKPKIITEIKTYGDNKQSSYGLRNTQFYNAWKNMYQRCLNSDHPNYKYYGGRGIKMCDRWRNFFYFIEDMYEFYEYHIEHYGSGRSECQLDRMDNEKGYYKDNCRWVTSKVNNNNRRYYERGSAVMITHKGKIQNIKKWAKELGFPYCALSQRLRVAKWSVEKALTTPLDNNKRMFTYKGKTKCLSQWAKEYKISQVLLSYRINKLKLEIGEALNRSVGKYTKK